MKLKEVREKLDAVLKSSETEDIEPPYRCLPPGSAAWREQKLKKILAVQVGERKVRCPNFGKPLKDCPTCHGTGYVDSPLTLADLLEGR